MSGRRRATCSVIQCMVMRIWRRYARCLTAMLLSVFVFYSLLCLSPNVWEIEPTLDNRWGDFALPATTSIGVERWVFRHRVDASGQTGLNEHWFNPEWDDSDWPLVHATFGPHGLWTGPLEPERLPAPLGTADEWDTSQSAAGQWREAV